MADTVVVIEIGQQIKQVEICFGDSLVLRSKVVESLCFLLDFPL